MTPSVEQLVRETLELTGADRPALLEDDAPVLAEEVVRPADGDGEEGFYLVGLIGGKEVGKSALVNALVGRPITAITSHGPGTEVAVAYAHQSQEAALRELLDREVPGRFRIVTHDAEGLRRQVLLDLPDIDSHYGSHLAVTRAMLRHMLYPVWVQSVEKYADLQPQQMLARVAAGNAVQNFVFCLNKVDQLDGQQGEAAALPSLGTPGKGRVGVSPGNRSPSKPPPQPSPGVPGAGEENSAGVAGPSPMMELRDDFAARLARTLSLSAPPEVFLISAISPGRYELPRLRGLLSREKTQKAVRHSRELAGRRQDRSLLDWLAGQKLSERAERLGRLRSEAEELAAARLAVPLLEQVLPALTDDPASRQALADEILTDRVSRWPLVSLVHTLLAPLFVLIRTMGAKHAAPLQGAEVMADFYLKGAGGGSGWSAAQAVQSTFAQLRQSQPVLSTLYRTNKLWEDLPADSAATDLARRLSATLERQRVATRQRAAGRGGAWAAPIRWLLTIGALLWFPIIQPVLQLALNSPIDWSGLGWHHWRPLLGMIVSVLGTDYLLRSAGFLAIYFLVLWLALRWNTQRRVARMSARWRSANDPNPQLNLASQAMQWVDELTDAIRHAHDRMASLAERAATLKAETEKAA